MWIQQTWYCKSNGVVFVFSHFDWKNPWVTCSLELAHQLFSHHPINIFWWWISFISHTGVLKPLVILILAENLMERISRDFRLLVKCYQYYHETISSLLKVIDKSKPTKPDTVNAMEPFLLSENPYMIDNFGVWLFNFTLGLFHVLKSTYFEPKYAILDIIRAYPSGCALKGFLSDWRKCVFQKISGLITDEIFGFQLQEFRFIICTLHSSQDDLISYCLRSSCTRVFMSSGHTSLVYRVLVIDYDRCSHLAWLYPDVIWVTFEMVRVLWCFALGFSWHICRFLERHTFLWWTIFRIEQGWISVPKYGMHDSALISSQIHAVIP